MKVDMDRERWEQRARANCAAAEYLLQESEDAFAGPICSRIYYAVYQAVVAHCIKRGYRPETLPRPRPRRHRGLVAYWSHKLVGDNLRECDLTGDELEAFALIKSDRITADYGPEFMNRERAEWDLAQMRARRHTLGVGP